METHLQTFLVKVKSVAQGPYGDLLRQLVEVLYVQAEDEYDAEPLSAEDLAAIRAGEEAIAQGDYFTLDEVKRELGL